MISFKNEVVEGKIEFWYFIFRSQRSQIQIQFKFLMFAAKPDKMEDIGGYGLMSHLGMSIRINSKIYKSAKLIKEINIGRNDCGMNKGDWAILNKVNQEKIYFLIVKST